MRADEINYNWHGGDHVGTAFVPRPDNRGAQGRSWAGPRRIAKAGAAEVAGKYAIRSRARGQERARDRITAQDRRADAAESTHKTLSKREIAIIAQWIGNGAKYRPHWAPIHRAAAPKAAENGRSRAAQRTHDSIRVPKG